MEDYQQMEVVNNRIITLRGQQVIIDRDVAPNCMEWLLATLINQ